MKYFFRKLVYNICYSNLLATLFASQIKNIFLKFFFRLNIQHKHQTLVKILIKKCHIIFTIQMQNLISWNFSFRFKIIGTCIYFDFCRSKSTKVQNRNIYIYILKKLFSTAYENIIIFFLLILWPVGYNVLGNQCIILNTNEGYMWQCRKCLTWHWRDLKNSNVWSFSQILGIGGVENFLHALDYLLESFCNFFFI